MTSTFTAGEYTRMPYDGTPYQATATGVMPRFYKDSLIDPERSRKAKKPIFFEMENIYVELISPGDVKSSPVKKVTQDIIDQFPTEYAAFMRGEEVAVRGHAIDKWDVLTVGEVKSLKSFNIETVEQLAGVSDSILQNLGMGYRNRQTEARAFLNSLEVMKDDARDTQIAELQKQVAALTAMKIVEPVTEALGTVEPIKRGPGRPRTIEKGDTHVTSE